MPARPAPPARRRSTRVPCGTISYWILPAATQLPAGEGMLGRATKETMSRVTWSFSISFATAPPTVLPTRRSPVAPCSAAAASRLFGTPELSPNPETAIVAPFGISETASAADATTLSIVADVRGAWESTCVAARAASRRQPLRCGGQGVLFRAIFGGQLARQARRGGACHWRGRRRSTPRVRRRHAAQVPGARHPGRPLQRQLGRPARPRQLESAWVPQPLEYVRRRYPQATDTDLEGQ